MKAARPPPGVVPEGVDRPGFLPPRLDRLPPGVNNFHVDVALGSGLGAGSLPTGHDAAGEISEELIRYNAHDIELDAAPYAQRDVEISLCRLGRRGEHR